MIQKFNPDIRIIIEKIKDAVPSGTRVYLVGGAIRNLLLDLPIEDLDFIIEGPVKPVLQRVKRALYAKAYILDDARQTSRVIYAPAQGDPIDADFVTLSGGSLTTDLTSRDFTVNAIALDLQQSDAWIDPTSGIPDLHAGVLRCCSIQSMTLDPLRVLRGVRFAVEYDFSVDAKSLNVMKHAVPSLAGISGERIRDELFKCLQSKDPLKALQLMNSLGCFKVILTAISDMESIPAHPPHVHPLKEHTFRVVEILKQFTDGLVSDAQIGQDVFIEEVMPKLRPYRAQLKAHIAAEYPEGRTRLGLMLMGALYHDTGKPETLTQDSSESVHYYGHAEVSREHMLGLARTLGLSKREGELLACLVGNHMRIHQLANTGQAVSDRAIYRFFRDTGDIGLDLCLLSMADLQATYESTLSAEKLESELAVIARLMEAWFNRSQKVVSPPKLLDGNDIMRLFDLQPGPIFSQILAALVEAQAAGEVTDSEGAIRFVEDFLKEYPSDETA